MKYDFSLDMDNENSVSIILKQINPGSKVLEFGPAMGRMTKYMKEELNCEISIVELDKEGYQSSIQFAIDGYCGNAETLEWVTKFKNDQFDYIIFADVIEHLRNPEEVIRKSRTLLKDGGRIIVSVPNVAHNSIIIDLINNRFNYHSIGLLDNTHIKFFTYYSLQDMLAKCNLVTLQEKATYALPNETEFGNNYSDISSILADILKKKEFGYVYQYVFTCIRKEDYLQNKEVNIIKKDVNKFISIDTFKIYFNNGTGFNENSIVKKYINMGFNHIDINLENLSIENDIRLDFSEESCIVKLDQLQINSRDIDITALQGNYSYRLNNYFVFMNNDPYLFVHGISKEDKKLMLQFSIQKLYANDLEIEYFNNINMDEDNKSSKNNELEQMYSAKVNEIADLKNQLNQINTMLNEKDKKIQAMQEECDGKNERIQLMEDELKELYRTIYVKIRNKIHHKK